jgi:hypothetical protein
MQKRDRNGWFAEFKAWLAEIESLIYRVASILFLLFALAKLAKTELALW